MYSVSTDNSPATSASRFDAPAWRPTPENIALAGLFVLDNGSILIRALKHARNHLNSQIESDTEDDSTAADAEAENSELQRFVMQTFLVLHGQKDLEAPITADQLDAACEYMHSKFPDEQSTNPQTGQ